MEIIVDRMIRAAKLETSLYEEVERDQSATAQALTVVVVVAIASGLGGGIGALVNGIGGFLLGIISGALFAVISWVIWSAVAYFVGTSVFRGTATIGEVLRTVGFAQSPGVLAVLSFLPLLGGLISLGASIWVLVAFIVAIRAALDIDTTQAILTAIIGFIIIVAVTAILAAIFGGAALLGGALLG